MKVKTTTEGDINDIKAYAALIGVKCENCTNWRSDNKQCTKMNSHTQVTTTNDFFCADFEKKTNNEV